MGWPGIAVPPGSAHCPNQLPTGKQPKTWYTNTRVHSSLINSVLPTICHNLTFTKLFEDSTEHGPSKWHHRRDVIIRLTIVLFAWRSPYIYWHNLFLVPLEIEFWSFYFFEVWKSVQRFKSYEVFCHNIMLQVGMFWNGLKLSLKKRVSYLRFGAWQENGLHKKNGWP